jgi:cation:H+ antiporter
MFNDWLWFLAGIALIALGADSLVRGVAGLAHRAGAAALSIGLLVAAFGGSMPDLAVNIEAVARGHGELALGNIIGSCLVNLGLVLGSAALLRPLELRLPLLRPLGVALLASGFVLYAMSYNGRIGWYDGGALLAAFIALAVLVVRHGPTRAEPEVRAHFEAEALTPAAPLLGVIRIGIGAVVLYYGAQFAVTHSVAIARAFGVSELFAGLTVVAIGTSLPQIGLCLIAALRGRGDVVLASVVGSNFFNLTAILGVTALIRPYPVSASLTQLEFPALILFAASLYPMLRGDLRITRGEGAVLLLAFLALTGFQFWLVTR